MGLSHLPPDSLAAWVEASCAAQGVPVKVADPTVVSRVGALLGARVEGTRAQPRSGSTRPLGRGSVAPPDAHAGGVQGLHSGTARGDLDVVDQGGHDRVLPRQIEAAPGAA